MELVRGIAASAGLAVGTVRRLRHIQTGLGRVVMSPAQEFESFCAAAEIARAQLEEMEKKADSTQKDILGAQRMMLDDEGLREEIERYIKAGAGAAAAVERAAGIFAGRIRALRAGGEELLGPGDTIRVTPGVLHDFYNVGDAPAVVLAVTF